MHRSADGEYLLRRRKIERCLSERQKKLRVLKLRTSNPTFRSNPKCSAVFMRPQARSYKTRLEARPMSVQVLAILHLDELA